MKSLVFTRDFDHTALFYKILFLICANLLYIYKPIPTHTPTFSS